MHKGVEAHYIRCTVCARTGTPQFFTRQVIYHIARQPCSLSFYKREQHIGHANTVGHKVRRVFSTYHPFAQGGGDKGFQLVQHMRSCGGCGNKLYQIHIAWWIEEMDPAELRT